MKSTRSTTVAIVRQEIGLSAVDFGKLIRKGLGTVKSLESGRLKLSEKTALEISKATGVSLSWLLANDPKAPITDHLGRKWDRLVFESKDGERIRRDFSAFTKGGSVAMKHLKDKMQNGMINILCLRMRSILESQKGDNDKLPILYAKVDRFLYDLERAYGHTPDDLTLKAQALVETLSETVEALNRSGVELPPIDPKSIPPKPPGWPFNDSA
jgi:transcriptional regulator with XRE-family HTH domain